MAINSRRNAKPFSIVHHGLIKHGGNHVIAVIASHLGYPNRIDYEQETKGPQRERLTLKGVLMPPPTVAETMNLQALADNTAITKPRNCNVKNVNQMRLTCNIFSCFVPADFCKILSYLVLANLKPEKI